MDTPIYSRTYGKIYANDQKRSIILIILKIKPKFNSSWESNTEKDKKNFKKLNNDGRKWQPQKHEKIRWKWVAHCIFLLYSSLLLLLFSGPNEESSNQETNQQMVSVIKFDSTFSKYVGKIWELRYKIFWPVDFPVMLISCLSFCYF